MELLTTMNIQQIQTIHEFPLINGLCKDIHYILPGVNLLHFNYDKDQVMI